MALDGWLRYEVPRFSIGKKIEAIELCIIRYVPEIGFVLR